MPFTKILASANDAFVDSSNAYGKCSNFPKRVRPCTLSSLVLIAYKDDVDDKRRLLSPRSSSKYLRPLTNRDGHFRFLF